MRRASAFAVAAALALALAAPARASQEPPAAPAAVQDIAVRTEPPLAPLQDKASGEESLQAPKSARIRIHVDAILADGTRRDVTHDPGTVLTCLSPGAATLLKNELLFQPTAAPYQAVRVQVNHGAFATLLSFVVLPEVDLPEPLAEAIRVRFKGFRPPTTADIPPQVLRARGYPLVRGDFDGDRLEDTALLLVSATAWKFVVFLQTREGGYVPGFLSEGVIERGASGRSTERVTIQTIPGGSPSVPCRSGDDCLYADLPSGSGWIVWDEGALRWRP